MVGTPSSAASRRIVSASSPSRSAIASAAAPIASSVSSGRVRPACRRARIQIEGRFDIRYSVPISYIVPNRYTVRRRIGMHSIDHAVRAEGLGKRFGPNWALRRVDFEVARGRVLGLLGRNGAGKTTTVRILTTLLRPDEGRAFVDGLDVVRQAARVRPRIGLAGQQATVDELLTGRANLEMIGRLYHLPRRVARARATQLLASFDLTDAAGKPVKSYSGGMRRRLDLAASLVASPPVLFLDEPTTGLDPHSRNDLWTMLRELVSQGTTLVLTTQYLDEADRLADDIIVVDHGRVIAEGAPDQLKAH